MNFKSFCEQLAKEISRIYADTTVQIVDVAKNNGVTYKALNVTKNGSKLSEVIYLDDLYEKFCNGVSFAEIISRIDAARQKSKDANFDLEFYKDFDKVRSRIHIKLVGYESNKGFLEQCPHRKFKDLAILYYVRIADRPSEGIVVIKNEHINLWDVKENELYNAAMENATKESDFELLPMADVIGYGMCDSFMNNFLILSNKDRTYGASVMLTPGLLQAISRKYDKSYYIIPSSIHECILILDEEREFNLDMAMQLKALVGFVNASEVEAEDVLTENVYYFDRNGDKLIDTSAMQCKEMLA